jgi:mannose-1-phosphate guanylyltransferase / mannose-6-phosphate isomerase
MHVWFETATINRVIPPCAVDEVVVVSSSEHVSGEGYHLMRPYQLIAEPVGRNTAPAIAIAAAYLQQQNLSP